MKRVATLAALLALAPTLAVAQGLPSANTVYAGPATGSPSAPSFRTLVPADIPGNALNACINITSTTYGGSGNNSTDNATPLANAFAALTGNGGCIFFPPGKYKFNSAPSLTLPSGVFSVTLVGSGQDNTILTWPSGSGGITFNYAGVNSSVHIRDLSFTTGTTNGGNAVTLNLASANTNPAFTAQSDFYRVTCRGDDGYAVVDYWTICTNVANVSNVIWESVLFNGPGSPNGTGIKLLGLPGSSTYGVQYNIAKSTLQGLGSGIIYGSFIQGVSVDQTNFTGTTNAIISPASQTGVLAELLVTNSQFNPIGALANAIVTNTAIFNVGIANNLFLVQQNNTNSINLASSSQFTINNNQMAMLAFATNINGIIIGPSVASTTGVIAGNDILNCTNGIQIQTGALNTSILGNAISGGAGTTPIVVQSGVSNLTIQNNSLIGPSTTISNSSTSQTNSILNNPGYNPVGPSAITVGASPFTYTAGPSPETVYIFGGTVTGVNADKNGGAFAFAACAGPCTIDLGPNEQVKVAYTAAPTMNKMVH